ncbi:MAG: hypothetical protein KAG19_08335, partial [Methylococcales bacterium]|nr:hypothetical protein [Methylococcales bacterium]
VDLMIYDGFFSSDDKKVFEVIRKSSPEALATISLNVADERFDDLFLNYRARNFFGTLTVNEKKQWLANCQNIFNTDYKNYLPELAELIAQNQDKPKHLKVLNALQEHAVMIRESITA